MSLTLPIAFAKITNPEKIRVVVYQSNTFGHVPLTAITNKIDDKIAALDEKITTLSDKISTLDSEINQIKIPVGTTVFFDAKTAPEGFIARDGAMLNKADYSELYSIIGDRYGSTDSQFSVGDFRGYFIRGYDDKDTRDIGTTQSDAIRNITGSWGGPVISNHGQYTKGAFYGTTNDFPVDGDGGTGSQTKPSYGYGFSADRVVPVAGENRPKNINLLICIKY